MSRIIRAVVCTLAVTAVVGGIGACKPKPEQRKVTLRDSIAKRHEILMKDAAKRVSIAARFGFEDDTSSGMCVKPPPTLPADIDVDASLWIHDRATLDALDAMQKPRFTLRKTLDTLATQANLAGTTGVTAASLFTELWDTQNPAPGVGAGAHCDDNGKTVNGFPVSCRPTDGAQAQNAQAEIDRYQAIGLVNRLDLAHQGWRNCGEHRIVYGRTDGRRAFIIFEAVLPNPKPGCRSACKPVAEFWKSLTPLSPADRADALDRFYYKGLPGFRPVVHINHYTAEGTGSSYGSSGSGQIRTNQFLQGPWMLKEFRLALDCGATPCKLAVVPTMVKVNPFGDLWNQEIADGTTASPFQAQAIDFQGEALNQVGALAGRSGGACPTGGGNLNRIGYAVSQEFDAAESEAQSGGDSNYPQRFNAAGPVVTGEFRDLMNTSPDRCGLTAAQVVNRATAMNCGGCHQPSSFGLTSPNSIGPVTLPDGTPVTSWPSSLGFVHTNETAIGGVHALSDALTKAFLPERQRNLIDYLNSDTCPCARKFLGFGDALRAKGRRIESARFTALKPRFSAINDELKRIVERAHAEHRPIPPAPVAAATKRLRELEAQRDREIEAALTADGITVASVTPDLRPQPLRLEAAKLAGGNVKKENELRARAVMEIIRSEPPRETVTGQFWVH